MDSTKKMQQKMQDIYQSIHKAKHEVYKQVKEFDKLWEDFGSQMREKEEQLVSSLPKKWGDLPREAKRDASATTVECNSDIQCSLTALSKLYDLRQEYRRIAGGWEPNWEDGEVKYVIELIRGSSFISEVMNARYFLAFPSYEQVHHFLIHHKKLIEQAREFLS